MVKKIKRAIIAAIISTMMIGNVSSVYAKELDTANVEIVKNEVQKGAGNTYNLGTISGDAKYYKISVKSPGKISLKITGLSGNQTVNAAWCDSEKMSLTKEMNKVKEKAPYVTYYVKTPGIYYLRLRNMSSSKVKASYTFTPNSNQGGKSFSKATILKKDKKQTGIFGFETKMSDKQYYKFTVSKEELVKIKFSKGNSCSPMDTMKIEIFEKKDKKDAVTWGWIYEGQKGATLYIRNSEKHKTKPGTYYVVLSKVTKDAAFDYSLTWLKK